MYNSFRFYFTAICGLVVILGVCGHAQSDKGKSASAKPLVSVPYKNSFTTILSLDGGGTRTLISIMSLVVLEDSIKERILTKMSEELPKDSSIKTISDFEVSLADYFDIMTGTATGGWVAAYLASKGEYGSLEDLLKQRKIIKQHGRIAPSSAKALIVFFFEYAEVIYPTQQPTASKDTPKVPPGISTPLYTNKGKFVAMNALFGSSTLNDLETTCLIPILNLETGSIVTAVSDFLDGTLRIGYTNFTFANPVGLIGSVGSNISFTGDVDFNLKDIAVASSAFAALFPAINLTSVSGPKTKFPGADGFLPLAGNPTLHALAYAANRTETSSLENFAILSLGAGVQIGNYEDNANGGGYHWFASGEALQIMLALGGSDFSSQIDLLFSANPKVKQGQYLRIQTIADAGTERGNLYASFNNAAILPELRDVGKELASNFSDSIDQFVKDFVFG